MRNLRLSNAWSTDPRWNLAGAEEDHHRDDWADPARPVRLLSGHPGGDRELDRWWVTRRLNLLFGVLPEVFLGRLAETIRGQMAVLPKEPFVQAAHAVGATPRRAVRRHLLPHLAVRAALEIGLVVLL